MKERDLVLSEIYSRILKNGVFTEKQDVLDPDNRVYTKKIPVEITIDKVTIKFVSVSGYNKNLSDTSKNDVRINFKNYHNDFLNLFNTSVSDDTLNKILDYLKENE